MKKSLLATAMLSACLMTTGLLTSCGAGSQAKQNTSAADSGAIGTGAHFVFCSLTNSNGCSAIAIFNGTQPYSLWATSHTEQSGDAGFTLAQLWTATIGTNEAFTNNITSGSNNCTTTFGDGSYCQFNRDWTNGTDYIASEAAGTPYVTFADNTNYTIKVNIPGHGSSELNPTFYLPNTQVVQICIVPMTGPLPADAKLIQAFSSVGVDDRDQVDFSKGTVADLKNTLMTYGFTDVNFNCNF